MRPVLNAHKKKPACFHAGFHVTTCFFTDYQSAPAVFMVSPLICG
jgi:hypothetical protein